MKVIHPSSSSLAYYEDVAENNFYVMVIFPRRLQGRTNFSHQNAKLNAHVPLAPKSTLTRRQVRQWAPPSCFYSPRDKTAEEAAANPRPGPASTPPGARRRSLSFVSSRREAAGGGEREAAAGGRRRPREQEEGAEGSGVGASHKQAAGPRHKPLRWPEEHTQNLGVI